MMRPTLREALRAEPYLVPCLVVMVICGAIILAALP